MRAGPRGLDLKRCAPVPCEQIPAGRQHGQPHRAGSEKPQHQINETLPVAMSYMEPTKHPVLAMMPLERKFLASHGGFVHEAALGNGEHRHPFMV